MNRADSSPLWIRSAPWLLAACYTSAPAQYTAPTAVTEVAVTGSRIVRADHVAESPIATLSAHA